MRTMLTLSLLALPAAARAMYGSGCGSCSGGLLAGAAYAVVAVLGYWVLQQAVKESVVWLKRVGYALGGILAFVGALGLLCSVTNHSKGGANRACFGPGMMPPPMGMGMGPGGMNPGMRPGMMPPGHPPVDDMDMPEPGARKGGKSR